MILTRTFRIPYQNASISNYMKASNNLYNQALYIVRKHYEETGEYLNYNHMDKMMKTITNLEGGVNYRDVPVRVAQTTLQQLDKDYKSFFALIKKYNKSKDSFKGVPRPPKFKKKDGKNNIIFVVESRIDINRTIKLSRTKQTIQIPKGVWHQNMVDYKIIELVPHRTYISVHIVFEVDEISSNVCESNWIGVDIGLNNLMTTSSNVCSSIIYDGKPLKAINQYYNKKMAKLTSEKDLQGLKYQYTNRQDTLNQKRDDKIKDYLHKVSKQFVRHCLKYKIGTVIIGKNKEWKQNINLGKKTNQKFVMIPFERLLRYLEYKLQLVGIKIVFQEESYTSKADALSNDSIPVYGKNMKASYSFSGKRVKRGLYLSGVGVLLNADVNGSLNIAKKYLGKLFELPSIGFLLNPVRIQPNEDFDLRV